VAIVFLRALGVSVGGWLALRNGDYVRLPKTGEPAIELTMPMANDPPIRRQAIRPEQAREIDCGRDKPDSIRRDRTDIGNGEGVLALKNREGHRSRTLSPRPANRTARLKGRTR
jgi:hypothetical protein